MRFVGEVYMKDMLKAHVMHHCVGELLESRDNEKLACLCKLFQTIGKKLEDYELKKKRTKVADYFDKIAELAADKSLSSKVVAHSETSSRNRITYFGFYYFF